MSFAVGNTMGAGRPKGAENKSTKIARELFTSIMEGQVSHIEDALRDLREESSMKYLLVLSKFFPYFVPKKIDLTTDGEQISRVMVIPESVATPMTKDLTDGLDKGSEENS